MRLCTIASPLARSVTAPLKVRFKWLTKRNHVTRDPAFARQLPAWSGSCICSFVFDFSGVAYPLRWSQRVGRSFLFLVLALPRLYQLKSIDSKAAFPT